MIVATAPRDRPDEVVEVEAPVSGSSYEADVQMSSGFMGAVRVRGKEPCLD